MLHTDFISEDLLQAVVLRCSVKKVLLKTLQNSRENSWARVSFLIKSTGTYEVISSLRSQKETLQSELHFLRDELKEKSTLIKSLIGPDTLNIENKELKAKDFKNKVVYKNAKYSKETPKTD